MIALTLLLLAIGWLLVAAIAGFLAYKGTGKRWVQVATTIVVLWLPFWDVIPGWILYQKAVREVGGVRIYRTVEAEGYLDRSATDCYNCWSQLKDSPYRFLEVIVSAYDPLPRNTLTPVPGVYEFRLLERGNANCEAFDALPNVENLRRLHRLEDFCVAAMRREVPISRYEYERSKGWRVLGRIFPIPPIESSWQVVRDRDTGEVIAESHSVRFFSWIGGYIGVPQWRYDRLKSGRSLVIQVSDVITPI